MAQKTDQFLKERYIWKTQVRRGSSAFNFLFDDLSPGQQADLSSHIDESSTGIPVLLFTKPGDGWTLLCTRQVLGFDGQTYCAASLDDIEALHPAEMIGLNGTQRIHKAREVGKSEFDQLALKMKNGAHIVLHANKGADFYEMWSVLLMAARLHNWSGDDL